MKKIISLFAFTLLSLTTQQLLTHTKQEAYSYILKVRLARNMKLSEPIPGFYKGKPLELGADCAIIPESNKVSTFSIIITPEVTHEAEGNNIRYLRRKEEMPFAWYDLTLRTQTQDEDTEKITIWDIKKLESDEAPVQIPEHAIVIYYNPDFIEKLEDMNRTETCKTIDLASRVIALPAIVIRSDIDEEELNQACIEALLASLEPRTLHQKSSVATKREQRTIISLCKSL